MDGDNFHRDGNYSAVLVKNFPFTEKGRVKWWLANQEMLKSHYKIPEPAAYGSFTIIFWDFGEGYKEEGKYDRLCFPDMEVKEQCIEKEKEMTIYKYNNEELVFSFDGNSYAISGEKEIIEINPR